MERDEPGLMQCEPSAHLDDAGRSFFQLGLSYATGGAVSRDLVCAHTWLNVAATLGNDDAVRLRREIAAEMSKPEITAALRAARTWIATH
jgi:hypothetical protein